MRKDEQTYQPKKKQDEKCAHDFFYHNEMNELSTVGSSTFARRKRCYQ